MEKAASRSLHIAQDISVQRYIFNCSFLNTTKTLATPLSKNRVFNLWATLLLSFSYRQKTLIRSNAYALLL